MLPAGLFLLISAIVQLSTGDYTIGENIFGAPVGPGLRGTMGFVFTCVGAIFLWLYLRERSKPPPGPND
jgi:hypothetical protein